MQLEPTVGYSSVK